MPRPQKQRAVCKRYKCRRFESEGNPSTLELAFDELEAIRLSDLEELEQNEAARRMGISRGTLQRLVYSARKKLAFALTTGCSIALADNENTRTGCCTKKMCRFCPQKINNSIHGETKMKIAVTSENGQVFQHFGQTPEFTFFEVDNGKILSCKAEKTGACSYGALAGFLAEHKADMLICGGIGGGAQMALAEAGVKLLAGVSGDVKQAIEAFLKGSLEANPDFTCHHHEHEAGHACGDHGCGAGGCHH